MKHKILSVVLLTGACAMAANADSVKASQSIQLTPGWNAVYLTVAPTNTPDAFFADWPVDFVAAYDRSAFLETKQYSASNTTEGVQKSGYRIWHRGDPGATSLHGLAANTVYLCFATNAMAKEVYGVPRAPRISWHASAADGKMKVRLPMAVDGKGKMTLLQRLLHHKIVRRKTCGVCGDCCLAAET